MRDFFLIGILPMEVMILLLMIQLAILVIAIMLEEIPPHGSQRHLFPLTVMDFGQSTTRVVMVVLVFTMDMPILKSGNRFQAELENHKPAQEMFLMLFQVVHIQFNLMKLFILPSPSLPVLILTN